MILTVTLDSFIWRALFCAIFATVWWNWKHIVARIAKPNNLKIIGKFLQLTKALTASLLAQSVGVSGHQLLLCNNVIGEIISYSANYLQEFRFATTTNTFSVAVNHERETCKRHISIPSQTFKRITNAVIEATRDTSIQVQVLRTSSTELCVATDINNIQLCVEGVPLDVSGTSKAGAAITTWIVSSSHFKTVQLLSNFLDSLDPLLVKKPLTGKDDEETDVVGKRSFTTQIVVPRIMTTNFGQNLPNELFATISSAMAPYSANFTQILTCPGRHDQKLCIESEITGSCSHTFEFHMQDILIESTFVDDQHCWQISTNSSYDVVKSFVRSLQSGEHMSVSVSPMINVFRWEKRVVGSDDNSNESQNPSSDTVHYDWKECNFNQQKTTEQYFLTRHVQDAVLDRLAGAFETIEMRKRMGVGLNHNFLLEGQAGTGKTTLAYYFAKILQQKYQLSVSVVHFDSEVFRSADSFRQASHKLENSKDTFDTQVVLIDEADKLPFFRRLAGCGSGDNAGIDGVDASTFLTWLDTGSVANNKSRFVFAMVNDRSILENANQQTSSALFRDGRFGHRVHVGGCDAMQFKGICEFVFGTMQFEQAADKRDGDDGNSVLVANMMQKMLALCEKHKNHVVSPLTVQKVQTLILQSNFELEPFLRSALASFE